MGTTAEFPFEDTAEEDEAFANEINNADELAYLIVSDTFHQKGKNVAATKLLELWKDGSRGGVKLDHLAVVGDHAEEPHKSEANKVISANI